MNYWQNEIKSQLTRTIGSLNEGDFDYIYRLTTRGNQYSKFAHLLLLTLTLTLTAVRCLLRSTTGISRSVPLLRQIHFHAMMASLTAP